MTYRPSVQHQHYGDRSERRGEAFWVDKDGIPHWDGADMIYMKQYRQRVGLEYEAIFGDTDWAKSQRATLGLRMTRGLTGRAWDAVEPLLADLEALKVDGGHKAVIAALEKLDKAEILRKQSKFDDFFKRSLRRHGQEMQEYVRQFERRYTEMTVLDGSTKISDDLYAYFLLENARLQDSQKKLVTMIADSEFETKQFVKCLTTNFHDLHLHERRGPQEKKPFEKRGGKGDRGKGDRAHWTEDQEEEEDFDDADQADEDETGDDMEDDEADVAESDDGASQDESIAEAHAAYDAARKQLRQQQTDRGFIRRDGRKNDAKAGRPAQSDDRRAAVAEQKKKSRCGACGETGHWAGDAECKKPKRKSGGKGGRGKGRERRPKSHQSYFVIDDGDEVFMEEAVFMMDTDDSWEKCQPNTGDEKKKTEKAAEKTEKTAAKSEKTAAAAASSPASAEDCKHTEWRKYGNKHAQWWNCCACKERMKTEKRESDSEKSATEKEKPKAAPTKAKPEEKKLPPVGVPEKFANVQGGPKKRYEKKVLSDDCKHLEEVRYDNQHAAWWNCVDCKGRIRTQKTGQRMEWAPNAPAQAPKPKGTAVKTGSATSPAEPEAGVAPAGATQKQP